MGYKSVIRSKKKTKGDAFTKEELKEAVKKTDKHFLPGWGHEPPHAGHQKPATDRNKQLHNLTSQTTKEPRPKYFDPSCSKAVVNHYQLRTVFPETHVYRPEDLMPKTSIMGSEYHPTEEELLNANGDEMLERFQQRRKEEEEKERRYIEQERRKNLYKFYGRDVYWR